MWFCSSVGVDGGKSNLSAESVLKYFEFKFVVHLVSNCIQFG